MLVAIGVRLEDICIKWTIARIVHPKHHRDDAWLVGCDIPVEAQRNRLLLMGLMTAAGWDFYRNEWWHYQLFDARRYPLVSDADLPRPMM